MEAEAEAVGGRLKEAEAEAKEKFTAVASLPTLALLIVIFKGTILSGERFLKIENKWHLYFHK